MRTAIFAVLTGTSLLLTGCGGNDKGASQASRPDSAHPPRVEVHTPAEPPTADLPIRLPNPEPAAESSSPDIPETAFPKTSVSPERFVVEPSPPAHPGGTANLAVDPPPTENPPHDPLAPLTADDLPATSKGVIGFTSSANKHELKQPMRLPSASSFSAMAPSSAAESPAAMSAESQSPATPNRTDTEAAESGELRAESQSPDVPNRTGGEEHSSTVSDASGKKEEEDADSTLVTVYYGTDRKAMNLTAVGAKEIYQYLGPAMIAAVLAIAFAALALFVKSRRVLFAVFSVLAAVATVSLFYPSVEGLLTLARSVDKEGPKYGNKRGELHMGVCEVSIPKRHEVGEVESPSLLRLEVREDRSKHVVLERVERQEEDAFYTGLADRVAQSQGKELLVFVHGFNVTFEDAARRTAQIAHDLRFPGAPVFYSWPSQGGLLQYSVDETNVVWTVPHLKQFLLDIAARSSAQSINLIAHSMGNRALTSALHQLEMQLDDEAALFNQVVLAAPDIDAEVFRRDIAPSIARTAKQVTLYASSNDQALIASKQVHGYSRAGESGKDLVVVPGIETIDVSEIDTSLLGHSYYGSSDSILTDLYHLIQEARPASLRHWLRPQPRNGLTYWVFPIGQTTARNPQPNPQ